MRTNTVIFLTALLCLVTAGRPAAAQCSAPIDLGRGPVNFFVPSSYDPDSPAPLVVLLHGYTGSGAGTEAYVRLRPLAEEFGFLYAYPDGTLDRIGSRFWNATDACCNFFNSGVDDSGYLRDFVDAVAAQCNVDPRRVYFVGHSNGGFMSYRMACDHADVVAAIASLAGATFFEPSDCTPSEPVHVLQIHGTADGVINYNGGNLLGNEYPGAVGSVERWAAYDECEIVGEAGPPRDLDRGLSGEETDVTRYVTDCLPGGSGELWSIAGGAHSPNLSDTFGRQVIEHLLAHPKPGSCSGGEMIRKAQCKSRNGRGKLKIVMTGGLPGDSFRVELSGGESASGQLNGKGKGKAKFKNLPQGAGTATATWGCGTVAERDYDCP